MAKAQTCYTTDVPFLNSVSPELVYRIIQWLSFSYAFLRKALTLLLAYTFHRFNTDIILSRSFQNKETSHPSLTSLFQIPKSLKNEMLHTVPRQSQLRPPPMQHFIPPFFQPLPELSPYEKYPLLIHTQPLIPGQVYISQVDDDGSVLPSPPTSRCSSSTLALCDDDTRKIFTPCPGPDRMLTPPPVCEKREQLMIRGLLMMSSHAYSYAAPFYAVNQSRDRDNKNQKHDEGLSRQPLRPPPPPLEVAPYRSLKRTWKKHFMDGLEAPDLPIMNYHARRLVYCNCTWDEDELMHLSRAFVWRASGRGGTPTNLLAAFASQVHQVFHIAPWMGTDENFRRCLWYVVRETFVSSWHFEEQKVSRQAVTYTKNPSPGYMEYVVCALSVCSFIGDLFRYDFITRPDTVGCIRVLLYNLTTVEHVTAIHNIIQHAGVPLWREAQNLDAEVGEFRKVLLKKSQSLKDYRTVLLQPIGGDGGVRSRVNDILDHVEDCRLAVRRT